MLRIYQSYQAPFGTLYLYSNGTSITALTTKILPNYSLQSSPLIREAKQQLDAYFSNQLKTFSLPLLQFGTTFQLKVWESLKQIPYAQTRTYAQIAKNISHKNACRAVGNACSKNQLLIFIPCHRVIAKQHIGGFALNPLIKKFLLNLEAQSNYF